MGGPGIDVGVSGIPAGEFGIDISGCVGLDEETYEPANFGTTFGISVNANPTSSGFSYDGSYTGVYKIGNVFDWAYKIDDTILSW